MQTEGAPDRESQRSVCPGLSNNQAWDQPAALRGELYASEHLVTHAAEVAAAHGPPVLRRSAGPLRRRFAQARSELRSAYEVLTRAAKNQRDPSPAEEWLLDNSYVVEDQIREIQEDLPRGYLVELPRLARGDMAGYPRVYGLCLDYLRHTDACLDLGGLADYVVSYQRVQGLTIGELWAVPIMLRLGLTLTVSALAASEARAQDRERANEWADRFIVEADDEAGLRQQLVALERSDTEITSKLLVQLLKRVREYDAPLLPVVDWIAQRCEAMGTTPDDLTRREHLRQAADHVSVGNAITSMRAIAALDWTDFFELTSSVEEVLRRDPCAAYRQMDDASRDRCRHAVEQLSRRSKLGEREVAEAALKLAQDAAEAEPDSARAHVGYYLLDSGRRQLELSIGYRAPLAEWLRRPLLAAPTPWYLGAMLLLVGVACAGAASLLGHYLHSPWVLVPLLVLFALPASELVLSVLNACVLVALPPRVLPKLDFEQGIPDEHRTLVVVPCLLVSAAGVAELLDDLEIRSLANPGKNLYFALLTDWVDAEVAERESDTQLLELAKEGITRLNQACGEERYFLLHRKRVWNAPQGCYMGWERKRGKLQELNRLLRGATDTSFSLVTAPQELLGSVRYVITLDADTQLPREVARRLVGAMAHPVNRPVLDAHRRVVRGYGIIQPRVGSSPKSSRRTRFARIFAGPPGIDPYTTEVSDVYQDLFGEGSFLGKGIYDVDAFQAALAGRVPEDRLLSHDLFEGSFARSALATDIEVLDEQPASYEVSASRDHRWLRGDWQLLPWLLPRVPAAGSGGARRKNELRALDFWKLFDNLRRSLVPPALVLLLILSCFGPRPLTGAAVLLLLAVFLVPIVVRQLLSWTRMLASERAKLEPVGGDLWLNVKQAGLGVVLLLDHALLSIDAIVRTAYRLLVSRRHLLEWTTMSQAAARFGGDGTPRASRRFAASGWLSFALLAVVASRPNLLYAFVFLLPWMWAPSFVGALGRSEPEPAPDAGLTEGGRRRLRLLARKTWRFFDELVTEHDHWLPPDNFQEEPRGVVAHRTSPTNIGLYLMSVVAARDLGFIAGGEALTRLTNTLDTLGRLERRSGHVLNWYDTTTLHPLEPQYVSTVDSGNLAAYLWTVREACVELSSQPLYDAHIFEAARDALCLAAQVLEPSKTELPDELTKVDRLLENAANLELGSIDAFASLTSARDALVELLGSTWAKTLDGGARYWLEQAEGVLARARAQLAELAPCLEWLGLARESWPDGPAEELYDELVARMSIAKSPPELSAAAESFLDDWAELEQRSLTIGSPALMQVLQGLQQRLEQTREACEAFGVRAQELARRLNELADGMDFRFLYDESRSLFSIGYNVSGARLDGSHYDLLASEARLASLVAISKGDAPVEHWWKLGRPRTSTSGGRALLSWSGSMFEYLMPVLVTGVSRDTLLWETCNAALALQRDYAIQHSTPWGISESAYNVMDLGMNYQYRAFGVPGLGFKNGLGEDLVIAPYACVLAAQVRPDLALRNFEQLDRVGLGGKYGYYEAIDYTRARVPPERRSVVVKAFMAHHQGMSLVSLCNVLCNWPMRRRFFADSRIKASALLLEERRPDSAPITTPRTDHATWSSAVEPELRLTDHVGLVARGLERLHLLGQGELSTIVTASGTGMLTWRGMDVTRARDDSALDAYGIFMYFRNLTTRRLWSAGKQPTGVVPDYYDASFSIDRVELKRRDGAIETVTELVVSPEHPAEVRRVTLTNHGDRDVELEVTTYTEPVLAPRGADVAHRAFSSMFLSVEGLPERGAILVHRRPRNPGEAESWMVQALMPEGNDAGPLELEGSRVEFLGRGGSVRNPKALRLGHKLTGTTGDVLDPGLALRRALKVAAGGRVRLVLTTALATSRQAALDLLDLAVAPHASARAFELAWADARVELKHLGITAASSHRFQRLLSCLLRAPRALREVTATDAPPRGGKNALFSQGISGDLPLLVLRIDSPDFGELCGELLVAHEFWRINGVTCDLLFLNEEPEGYLQPINEAIEDLIRKSPAHGRENQAGGVFLRRAPQIPPEERLLILRAASVMLRTSAGSLSQQLRRAAEQAAYPEPLRVRSSRAEPSAAVSPPARDLRFFNGIGGFSPDGREYVMHVGPGARSPAPWCNVLSNERFGSVVSEQGLGFTWAQSSQRSRLTPWSNDAVEEPSGEAIYLRDDSDGSLWSATPAPASPSAEFKVRHGQGYTIFAHSQGGLDQELTVFVSPQDPVKLLQLRIKNRSGRKRNLSCFALVEWVLGPSRHATRLHVSSSWDAERSVLLANNPLGSTPEAHAFLACSAEVASHTGDREELFGVGGSRSRPPGLRRKALSGRTGVGYDPAGALQVELVLDPGQTRELCFVLGQGGNLAEAQLLAGRYVAPSTVARTFDSLGQVWDSVCAITAHTPDPAFDILLNRWLAYQVLAARFWGRTGFYQSSGAYGFRDQLQDVLALVHARPDLTREHLLRAAARQFKEGDVQHWWHPETGEGVRTRCSDDLLFLPYAVAAYVRATGDIQVLDEQLPFLEERALGEQDDDLFSAPRHAPGTASLYEHCVRALARGTTHGEHGLPKIGSGDWNDGMNRVGHAGRGESIWLGWFLARTLDDFAPLATARGESERAAGYRAEAERLRQALDNSWDGAWYRRAYYDDGTPIGSHLSPECRIDAIAQSWSVLAGGDKGKARRAVDSSLSELVDEDARLMRLLTPPFASSEPDPGYIRSYPPGIRENGGQYTHGVLWTIQALCALGEGERAHWLFSLLNPITHASNPVETKRYCVEPYVVAADVYASPQHMGRGGWTWYTGAAAWMYRIGVEAILGLTRRGQTLDVAPCVPPTWREFSVTYRYGRSELSLTFQNPRGVATGVDRIELDERALDGASIPLVDDGKRHRATVILGAPHEGASTPKNPPLQAGRASSP